MTTNELYQNHLGADTRVQDVVLDEGTGGSSGRGLVLRVAMTAMNVGRYCSQNEDM